MCYIRKKIERENPIFRKRRKRTCSHGTINLSGGSHPQRSATARWGSHKNLFARGFLVVPHRFLEHYSLLDPPLSTGEALFVLHLMSFKWDRELPFPSYKSLAQRMGVSEKAVRRYGAISGSEGVSPETVSEEGVESLRSNRPFRRPRGLPNSGSIKRTEITFSTRYGYSRRFKRNGDSRSLQEVTPIGTTSPLSENAHIFGTS